MKVLVTGGGGFLGSRIVLNLLDEGHSVVAYQRSDHPRLRHLGVDVKQGSLIEKDVLANALAGCDAVIHTAAKAGVWGPRKDYFRTNVDGTRTLIEAMESTGVSKLVHCSSPSVVFNRQSFEGEDESLPYGSKWLCPYPESKAVAEQMVLEWGRQGNGKVIALRPHLIWGVGDPHLFPDVIQRSQSGRLRIIGNGRNRVDSTRVENAAAAHLLALRNLDNTDAVNRPYFISQGDPPPIWDWINDMLRRVNVPILKKRVPLSLAYPLAFLAESAWRISGRQAIPPMTRFVAVQLAKSHWFSIDAARKHLGYKPENFPTEEGMELYSKAWLAGNAN
ncbi:MAG: NAD-dependent epimerase/dehydratase family protein [Puniceicoccaceae bacterium]